MLKTRVITALVLLAVLLLILYFNSYSAFALAAAVFFCAARWESLRLFGARFPLNGAALWVAAFLLIAFVDGESTFAPHRYVQDIEAYGASVAIWAVCLTPSLAVGLPPIDAAGNRLVSVVFGVSTLACFVAMLAFFKHSAVYLLSVLAIVWVADIGAYFSGKAFGKRKLAPSISPGKSWEGVVGGWGAVLLLAACSTRALILKDTFASRLLASWGWFGWLSVLTLIVAASVVGDLFESQLKRRAGMKDSSKLLPGHGGVLDRIDALIPVLPLAGLLDYLM